jgi:hypothetical protein
MSELEIFGCLTLLIKILENEEFLNIINLKASDLNLKNKRFLYDFYKLYRMVLRTAGLLTTGSILILEDFMNWVTFF